MYLDSLLQTFDSAETCLFWDRENRRFGLLGGQKGITRGAPAKGVIVFFFVWGSVWFEKRSLGGWGLPPLHVSHQKNTTCTENLIIIKHFQSPPSFSLTHTKKR